LARYDRDFQLELTHIAQPLVIGHIID